MLIFICCQKWDQTGPHLYFTKLLIPYYHIKVSEIAYNNQRQVPANQAATIRLPDWASLNRKQAYIKLITHVTHIKNHNLISYKSST